MHGYIHKPPEWNFSELQRILVPGGHLCHQQQGPHGLHHDAKLRTTRGHAASSCGGDFEGALKLWANAKRKSAVITLL